MTDLTPTIAAKSDQLNADDLIGGPKTITITRVTSGTPDQPINVYYEGDDGKPWKPCKSMRRVLVALWGAKGDKYVGRSITLFRDPSVKWGGIEVGGVRISHMSDIDNDTAFQLTVTRGKKEPYKVRKLAKQEAPSVDTIVSAILNAKDADHVERMVARADKLGLPKESADRIVEARRDALLRFMPAEGE